VLSELLQVLSSVDSSLAGDQLSCCDQPRNSIKTIVKA